jgi:hypothetical protein
MNILAIDLGKFNSMFCFFDSTSQSAEFLQAATSRSYIVWAMLRDESVETSNSRLCQLVLNPSSHPARRQLNANG